MAQFGSLARDRDVLEKEQIQSIVFGGFKDLKCSHVLGLGLQPETTATEILTLLQFVVQTTRWGDTRATGLGTQLALGPNMFDRLNFGRDGNSAITQNFSMPFQQGMTAEFRARVLGDQGAQAPDKWAWGNSDKPVDLVLMVYADTAKDLKAYLDQLAEIAKEANLVVHLDQDTTLPKDKDGVLREPFGFRDGISQPIIKGASQSFVTSQKEQVLEPGEFLCGYRDESTRVSQSICLSRSDMAASHLPRMMSDTAGPVFDFGRNGSYLVVRQLQQDVDGFQKYCDRAAKTCKEQYKDQTITSEYVQAKMIGRWKDGSSMVRHPRKPGNPANKKPDNDFSFRAEDPQGLGCPLGAHVRRANPRDSLQQDSQAIVKLSNRHRILRRGRPYANEKTKGIMFMCLNADIERQFEFMQDTWLNNSAFHGLQNESDPLFANHGKGGGRFSMPTQQGTMTLKRMPDFVQMRGGGYYFLPSKRALNFLIATVKDTALATKPDEI
ncbi:MAG: Dyp-type peroxidase [Pseudomonadota bacterium]